MKNNPTPLNQAKALKILNSQQVQKIDQQTINNQSINSVDLMERAAENLTHWILQNLDFHSFTFFCGLGNNGGDGVAIARLLSQRKKTVTLYLLKGKYSQDNLTNQQKLPAQVKTYFLELEQIEHLNIENNECVFDCLFGSGLNKPIVQDTLIGKWVQKINQLQGYKVAVDIPSGLTSNQNFGYDAVIFEADITLCIQIPKFNLLMPEYTKNVGKLILIDIGLDESAIEQQNSKDFFLTHNYIKKLLNSKVKNLAAHKGSNGQLLILAGQYKQMGCAILASQAAFKSGCGLLYIHTIDKAVNLIQQSIPEAICSTSNLVKNNQSNYIVDLPNFKNKFTAVCCGPGIGQDNLTLVQEALGQNKPLILDADALSVLAKNQELLKSLPANTILTPHPKEFERLCQKTFDTREQAITFQRELSEKYQLIILLKGRFTAISDTNATVYFNPTGNYAMAKGGSGDVLTGIIGSLLAQGYTAINATLIAAYLHGLAGDIAIKSIHPNSLIASDIIHHISSAYQLLD